MMSTTNMVSNVIKSDENITVKGLNQALEYFGIKQLSSHINDVQAQEISKFLLHKFSSVCNLKNMAEVIQKAISVEDLEQLKNELKYKITTFNTNSNYKPNRRKRFETLKSCFDDISGDTII